RYLIREVADGLVMVRDGAAVLHDGMDEELLAPSGATAAASPATPVTPAASATAGKLRKVGSDTGASHNEVSDEGVAGGQRRQNRAEARKRSAADRQARSAATRDARKRVQRLERQVAKADAEVERIGAELADPEIYDDHQRVRTLADEHEVAKVAAERLMADWLAAQEELDAASG
ncbi:MAG: hypothetical protein ACK5O2_16480, partial [Microthrixaceae bacterium]